MTWTRAAGTSHSTLTQGCGFGPTVKTQPATRYVSAMVATGMPDTMTRGLPGTVVTWPPCGQIIVSPTRRMGPGIVRSLTSRSARHGVGHAGRHHGGHVPR